MTIAHRVTLARTDAGIVVRGFRCDDGCVTSASFIARCPRCGRAAVPAAFGPHGRLWSKTTVRIPAGDYPPDRTIGYVDLQDGPRIVCELADDGIPIGVRVAIRGENEHGDPVAEQETTTGQRHRERT